jgi:L-2,4-diaminobutyrate decarboxylase
MMGTILYASLRAHGVGFFRAYVERVFALGQALASRIARAADFELAATPDANIVVFRYRPTGVAAGAPLDELQATLRRRCLEDGRWYFLTARLGGSLWLRTALMNPLAGDAELDGLLDAIRAAAVPA